jgi:hypothetical protein
MFEDTNGWKKRTAIKNEIHIVAKKLGFSNPTDFLNNWIYNGGTFTSLHKKLKEFGIHRAYQVVWRELRDYLTIPYDFPDAFFYRWNARARERGFRDARQMFNVFRGRHHLLSDSQIAAKLGLRDSRYARYVRERFKLRVVGTLPKRYKVSWCKDGFCWQSARERWNAKAQELGYSTLRSAVGNMRRRGLTQAEMAETFGVNPRTMRETIRRLRGGKRYGRDRKAKRREKKGRR